MLAVASELSLPVVPRGAGSNLSAGTIADRGGIMLTLTRMDRLLELDLENLVAVCQPALTNATLGAAAAEHGLLYPPAPGSRATSTIGGNVAENAGGLRGLKYGVTRDLGVFREPRALLAQVGEYVELPSASECCGAAGTYSLLRPRDSARILDDKLDAIEAAGVDLVVAVNPGCLRQLQTGLRRRRSRVRAIHLAELLAESHDNQEAP